MAHSHNTESSLDPLMALEEPLENYKERLGMDYMAVRSDSFALYKAFKEEVEKMGWIYNERFTEFNEEKVSLYDCMYFSYDFDFMEGEPVFAISNTRQKSFQLPEQWYSALNAAQKMIEANRHKVSVVLNEDYTAVIDTKTKKVRVGCQEFGFDKVLEVANTIRKQTKTK